MFNKHSCSFNTVLPLVGCIMYWAICAHDSVLSQNVLCSSAPDFCRTEDLCFLGSLFNVQLHLLETKKWKNRIKPRLHVAVFLPLNKLINERDVSAHFYYVWCHSLQWDESRLLHVDLLLISNNPWKILKKETQKCGTRPLY